MGREHSIHQKYVVFDHKCDRTLLNQYVSRRLTSSEFEPDLMIFTGACSNFCPLDNHLATFKKSLIFRAGVVPRLTATITLLRCCQI